RSLCPYSCEAKLETMNRMPIGKMRMAKALNAPAEVAATAAEPSSATSTTSHSPMAVWVERETMMGHASVSSDRSEMGRRCEGSAALKGHEPVAELRARGTPLDVDGGADVGVSQHDGELGGQLHGAAIDAG